MWSQGVRLDQGRVAAWWAAMEPFVAEMATVLATRGVAIDHPTYSLSSVTISQVASIFGVEEKVGTAVFAESTGHGNGVLMLECALPATLALEAAHEVFAAFTRGVGGLFDEPWALMDMRSTLAASLAAQTAGLELGGMVMIRWNQATFCFIPDWSEWNAAQNVELRTEAA